MQEQHESNGNDIVSRRLAVLLIVIGGLFAADSALDLSVAPKLWPVLLTIVAIGLIGIFIKRSSRGAGYLGGGVYLLCFSGLALYCNFTAWGRLGATWPAFVAFLAFAFLSVFFACGRNRWYLLLGLLLLSTAVVLWLFLALSGRLWWTAFILVGVSLLVWERVR